MREFGHWDKYLDELSGDIYPSPADEGHTSLLEEYLTRWGLYFRGYGSVLDVGCGDDKIAESSFTKLGLEYTGISLETGDDFNFLPDDTYGVIFSRHSLEHSPAPLLTLMEWHRVSLGLLGLIVPNPDDVTFVGRNHYSVADRHQVVWWLRRAGWKIIVARFTDKEFQFVCEKMPRVSHEGYASAPLSDFVHEIERDGLDVMDTDILFDDLELALKRKRQEEMYERMMHEYRVRQGKSKK